MHEEVNPTEEIAAATLHVKRLTALAYLGFAAAVLVVGSFSLREYLKKVSTNCDAGAL